MLMLNREATRHALSHKDCIAVLRDAMVSVSRREAELPLRRYLNIPGTQGKFTLMPGYTKVPRTFGVKIVSKFPRAPDSPHSSHVGAVMVFEPEEGIPLAMLDGAELTAIRTASASALATDALARTDATSLGIVGCGEEAWHHALAVSEVRGIDTINVWGRKIERAQQLAQRLQGHVSATILATDDLQTMAAASDIVCTVTSATKPILQGAWLQPGVHVNLVGAAVATSAEADAKVVTRSRFYTDYRPSAMDQAGELLDAIGQGLVTEEHIVGEIGEVLAGKVSARRDADEITVYKSLGVAAQDFAAGLAAFEYAKAKGLGIEVPW